ncbi:MAG: hypothetical protein ACYTKD_31700 [Planctomycetota bacterium]|jgi:hypothetical protein
MTDTTSEGTAEQATVPSPEEGTQTTTTGAPTAETPAPAGAGQTVDVDRIAAAARKDAERKHSDEIAKLTAEIQQYKDTEKQRQKAEMSEVERAQAEAREAKETAEKAAKAREDLEAELVTEKRNASIAMKLAASPTQVPPAYHAIVNVFLAEAEQVTQEAVDAATEQAHAIWQADLKKYAGIEPEPEPQPAPPQNVGSAGQPAAQTPAREVPPAEQEAADMELAERVRRGDPEAIAEAAKRYRIQR